METFRGRTPIDAILDQYWPIFGLQKYFIQNLPFLRAFQNIIGKSYMYQ